MNPTANYSDRAPMQVGQKVQGKHNGGTRFGEVFEANDRLYFVRWADGFRCTAMQGFDYGEDLQAVPSAIDAREQQPNTVGAIDCETGRVCVLVADYAASGLNGDAPAYWYSADAASFCMDPWALIDGIDPHVSGQQFDVWFASGSCKTVGRDAVLYLAAKHAESLQPIEGGAK